MKSQILLFISLFFITALGIQAQAPGAMKYQAVARNQNGEIIKDQSIRFQLSIHESTWNGEVVYSENHLVTTNALGIVHMNIGQGENTVGELSGIDWGSNDHFLEVGMDPDGGTDFISMGTAQLLTVPYAFFADNGVNFNPDLICDDSTEGRIRYNFETKQLELCNGEAWVELGESSSSFNCGNPLIDQRDGQEYNTVKIGNQCWMAENLNYGVVKESIFSNEGHTDVSDNGVAEKYAYDNDEDNLTQYGGLYDWNELMDYSATESSRGLCPEGWHVPSYDEFVVLVETAGDWIEAGKALKVGGSTDFDFPLGGNRREKGNFTGGSGISGSVWTSTFSVSHPDSRAWNIYFIEASDHAAKATDVMAVGKSCRCIKN